MEITGYLNRAREPAERKSAMATTLGIIEGFYGPMWTWQERRQLVRTLAPHGYGFYLYAPKADVFLRRKWQ